jgi:hypothetical protein
MTSKFRILLLVPFLMAMQCDEDEIPCGVEFTNNYSVNVENINETYASGETIWFNAEVSSELNNSCNNNQSEVIFDSTISCNCVITTHKLYIIIKTIVRLKNLGIILLL